MSKAKERPCRQCGNVFLVTRPCQRFCDAGCRSKYFNAKLAADKLRGRVRRPKSKPPERPRAPVLALSLAEQLSAAERQLAQQAATIRKLQQAVAAAERRVELAEASTRRAYQGFAAAGGRR